MEKFTLKESHVIIHEDLPASPHITVTCDAEYTHCDDGYLVVEYSNIDYETWGSC